MPTTAAIQWLSWNHARLLALILNALGGLELYFDSNPNDLTVNELFGLRRAQTLLHQLDTSFAANGMNKEVFVAIRGLSQKTDMIIERGMDRLKSKNEKLAEEANFLLTNRNEKIAEYRRLDERWRWSSKTVKFSGQQAWIDASGHGRFLQCLLELHNCQLSDGCMRTYGVDAIARGLTVSTQLVYLASVRTFSCSAQLNRFIEGQGQKRATTTDDLITELCTNFYDETSKLRKDRRKLARSDSAAIQVITEQIFVCGQLGFAEFVDPHLLETILAWQDPKSGGYIGVKPEPVPAHNIMQPLDDVKPKEELPSSSMNEVHTPHRSMLALNALTVSLRLLIDPPSWPELRLHDQELLVQMHQIPAEDRFKQFRYIQWVRDASLPTDLRLRPPPFAWSPDLIAFVVLAFIFVAGSVVAHYVFTQQYRPGIGPRPHTAKQFYMYAYKQL